VPIATIHVLEGRYDEARLGHVSKAVQDALISVLRVPSDDFFQVIHVLPRNRFLHPPSFPGMRYSDDLILLEVAFISGARKSVHSSPPEPLRTERCHSHSHQHRQMESHELSRR